VIYEYIYIYIYIYTGRVFASVRMAKLHEMGCRGLSEEGHDGRVGTRTERDCERSREKDWGREKEREGERYRDKDWVRDREGVRELGQDRKGDRGGEGERTRGQHQDYLAGHGKSARRRDFHEDFDTSLDRRGAYSDPPNKGGVRREFIWNEDPSEQRQEARTRREEASTKRGFQWIEERRERETMRESLEIGTYLEIAGRYDQDRVVSEATNAPRERERETMTIKTHASPPRAPRQVSIFFFLSLRLGPKLQSLNHTA